MEEKKVIWITGASSGIGKAVAIKFAENGWTVAVSARRQNLLNELKQINQNIYPFPLDVTDIEKCKLVASNIINQFNAGASNGDILKYIGNLSDVESSANVTTGSDSNDDLLSADFVSNAKNASLDITHLVVGFTTAVTSTGQAGGTAIDFTGAGISSSMILGAIETSLENANDGSGGGNGLLSGASGAQVTQGDISESKLLLFTDGGSGTAQDVAMVLYEEGSASEANFNTELTLASVLKSVDISTLTHDNFWG